MTFTDLGCVVLEARDSSRLARLLCSSIVTSLLTVLTGNFISPIQAFQLAGLLIPLALALAVIFMAFPLMGSLPFLAFNENYWRWRWRRGRRIGLG